MAKSTGKSLVIVESPAKARTISKFLGSDYQVEASIGHVRDLPAGKKEVPEKYKSEPWAYLGVNIDHDFEPLYIVPEDKKKQVKKLKDALKQADNLYLATDEDREGEAISWHLQELLKPKVPVYPPGLSRDHERGDPERARSQLVKSMAPWCGPKKLGGFWTGCTGSICRTCCGERSAKGPVPAESKASRCD